MKNQVGFRFAPTGEELINHYLKNKILGKTWLVEKVISEINICSKDPKSLPSLSKIQSEDLVWYFFSPKVYANSKKKTMKRATDSGFWKPTGKDRIIRGKRGNGVEVGIKKTLVYHEGKVGNGVGTPWVMHEYHITSLPPNLRNYVICQVMYKGEDPFVANNHSEPSQSLVSSNLRTVRAINTVPEFKQLGQDIVNDLPVDDSRNLVNEQEDLSVWNGLDLDTLISENYNPSVPLEAPSDDEFLGGLRHVDRGNVEFLFAPEESISIPNITLSEISADYRLDSIQNAGVISEMHYQGTSSSGGGYDLQTYAETPIRIRGATRRLRLQTLEVKQDTSMDKNTSMVKTEKKSSSIAEKLMETNDKIPRCIYLMIKMIGFILLLGLIGNIISVLR